MKATWIWHDFDFLGLKETGMNPRWIRDESAMNLPWIWHASAMKLFGKTIKIRRNKAPWKCHERAMKPTWIWHIAKNEAEIRQKKTNRQPTPTFWTTFPIDFGRLYPGKACMWKCHETAMKVTWIWHDFDFLGLKETETVQAHVRFMALYPKNYFQIVMAVLSCLCLPFLIFSLVIFQIYQSFCVFLWSIYRVIRNTQTTNPNPQLSLTWLKVVGKNTISTCVFPKWNIRISRGSCWPHAKPQTQKGSSQSSKHSFSVARAVRFREGNLGSRKRLNFLPFSRQKSIQPRKTKIATVKFTTFSRRYIFIPGSSQSC